MNKHWLTDGKLHTTQGIREESELEKREGWIGDENEVTHWIEFYDGEKLVHRSVCVGLKPRE